MKKNEMTRRVLAVLLAFVLTLGLLPTSAFAARIPDEVQTATPEETVQNDQVNLAASGIKYHGKVTWHVTGHVKSGSSSGTIDLGDRTGSSWSNVSYTIPSLGSLGVTLEDGWVVDYVSVTGNSSGNRSVGASFLLGMSGGSMYYYVKQTHTHSYTNFSYYSTQPTCYATGTAVYSCSCGQTTTQTVAKLSADYTGQSWVNQGDGTEKIVCRNCNGGASGHSQTRAAQLQNVTLTYNGNGATGGAVPTQAAVASGTSVTIKGKNTLAKTNCTFLGWSTDPDATEVDWVEGDSMKLNGNTTLYAVWEGPNSTYTLKKVFAGGVDAEDVENFSMDYSVVAGTHTYTTTLTLDNCASFDETTMTATWSAPYYYNMGANNAITVVEHGDVDGYTYTSKGSSGSVNDATRTWTFTVSAMASGATRTITNTYTAPQATYQVKWQDSEGNTLGETETKSAVAVGTRVTAGAGDKKTIAGYTFKEDLSTLTDTVKADNSTALILVYAKNLWVKWVDDNGDELDEKGFDKVTPEPVKTIEDPTKAEDENFTYAFDHWDKSVDTDGNVTYTAAYNSVPKTPAVTPDPELAITKTSSKANGVMTYTVTVENTGNVPLYNLMLVDTMDKTLEPTADMDTVHAAVYAGDDEAKTTDLNADDARVEYLGTRTVKEPVRNDAGKIVWNARGGLDRNQNGKDVWDFTWKLPGAMAVGETLTFTYSARILYPTDGSSRVDYYNYADAVAGTDEGDDPAFDGAGGEQASLLDFIGAGSGGIGGGTGPVGDTEYKYTLTYDFAGGAWNEKSSHVEVVWSEKQYHSFAALDAAVLPTKDGQEFAGWLKKDSSALQLPLIATEEDPNVVVVAQWRAHEHTWTDKTDANGDPIWKNGQAPDCIHDGVKLQGCACGAEQDGETVAASGHDFTGAAWADTCTGGDHTTGNGKHEKVCTVCHGGLEGGKQELGHRYEGANDGWTQTKAPTATEAGEETRTCADCAHEETRAVAALGQNTVTWVDEDGTTVLAGPLTFTKGGDEPAYPHDAPTKDADEDNTYAFGGWTKAVDGNGDVTYTAAYTPTAKPVYAVTWKNGEETIDSGETKDPAKIPAIDPAKIPEAPAGKEFDGWEEPAVDEENKTITIQIKWKDKTPEEPEKKDLTVKWVSEDGKTVLDEKKFKEGEAEPEKTIADPGKADDASYTYTFDKWIKSTDDAGNITYTASYTRTPKSTGGSSGGGGGKRPVNPPEEDLDDPDVPLAELPTLNQDDHFAYIIGKPDGTIQPLANITRAEVVTIFFRIMTEEARRANWGEVSGFDDVAQGVWYNHAVCVAVNAGLVKGLPDGTFGGDRNITRAEFATIAARFLDQASQPAEKFTDIEGHWAENDINRAAVAGWIKGVGDGKFNPDANITRAEVMTLVNRMLNRKFDEDNTLADMVVWPDNADKDAWYYNDVQEATNDHDYDCQAGTLTETWTKITQPRDWSELEK